MSYSTLYGIAIKSNKISVIIKKMEIIQMDLWWRKEGKCLAGQIKTHTYGIVLLIMCHTNENLK